MTKPLIWIVVPAFNEEDNIVPFYEAVTKMATDKLADCEVEILYVDDGSRDQTWMRIQELVARDPHVHALSLSRNFGHQSALTAGLHHCGGDAVVTIDCDLQDPPQVIPELVAKWRAGNKIVYARRASRVDRPFKRITANLYYKLLSRTSDIEIPRNVGDFRLISREVLQSFLRLNEHARYLRGMVAWLGYKHAFVDYERPERIHGETHYPLRKMLKLAMDGLLNFTFFPLRVGMWIGLLSMLVSALFLIYMAVDATLHQVEYPLYKWLTVTLFGFMGLQFTFLWIIGEYIGRIYYDVRRRPLFIVGERLNLEPVE